jgi:hypothetical protein
MNDLINILFLYINTLQFILKITSGEKGLFD